jgi:GT2 family glycosyltransferase
MKVSIVILCWNDKKVILDCLASIYATTHTLEFEVIVSDNGSTDGSIQLIRKDFPKVRVIENGRNLRFAKGNNVAIQASTGEYVLILNPDTIIHEGALDKLVAYADKHPEGGAFGCRVLNKDGSYQGCIRPLPTARSEWCAALGIGRLPFLPESFHGFEYARWKGESERAVGWLAGCFILVRGELLKRIGGFDEQFFYYYEDTDLCNRIWKAGYSILYTPECSITHLGGQSTITRFTAISFALDGHVTRYLYHYKYFGAAGARSTRRATLVWLLTRRMVLALAQLVSPNEGRKKKLELYRGLFLWNYRVDPIRLVEHGEEPQLDLRARDRVLER